MLQVNYETNLKSGMEALEYYLRVSHLNKLPHKLSSVLVKCC